MALASCAYIGIYVFCADARPRTAVHLTRGSAPCGPFGVRASRSGNPTPSARANLAACDAASTPWHEGRVRIPPMFRCLYICRDLRPSSTRRLDRWSPSDARDTNRASPDTNIHECRLSIDIYQASRQGVRRAGPCGCFAVRATRSPNLTPSAQAHPATDIHITIIAPRLPIFVQPRRGVPPQAGFRVLARRRKHAVLTAGRAIPRRPPSMIW